MAEQQVPIQLIKKSIYNKLRIYDDLYDFIRQNNITTFQIYLDVVQQQLSMQVKDFRNYTDVFDNATDFKMHLMTLNCSYETFKILKEIEAHYCDDIILSSLESLYSSIIIFMGSMFLDELIRQFQNKLDPVSFFYQNLLQKLLQTNNQCVEIMQFHFQQQYFKYKQFLELDDSIQTSGQALVAIISHGCRLDELARKVSQSFVLFSTEYESIASLYKANEQILRLYLINDDDSLVNHLVKTKISFKLLKQRLDNAIDLVIKEQKSFVEQFCWQIDEGLINIEVLNTTYYEVAAYIIRIYGIINVTELHEGNAIQMYSIALTQKDLKKPRLNHKGVYNNGVLKIIE